MKGEGVEQYTKIYVEQDKAGEGGWRVERSLTLTVKGVINVLWAHGKLPTSGVQVGEVNSGIWGANGNE